MTSKIFAIAFSVFSILACTDKGTETTIPLDEDIVQDGTEDKEAPALTLTNVQKPILFDYTSTGCPGCGSWGAPTFDQIADEQKGAIVPIAVHIKYGDPMITDISNAIASNRTGQYYTPQLWVNNTNGMVLSGGSINSGGTISKLTNEINTSANEDPVIQVGVSSVVNDGKLSIRYATQANKELNGTYSIAIYVMENGILYRQASGATNPFEHSHVIRAGSNGPWGAELTELAVDTKIERELSIELQEEWNTDNLYVTAVIWKKVGNNYEIVNANNNYLH